MRIEYNPRKFLQRPAARWRLQLTPASGLALRFVVAAVVAICPLPVVLQGPPCLR
jgi:hypothetical protein